MGIDWLHCNTCYYKPELSQSSRLFKKTNCGHLFCEKCEPDGITECPICHSTTVSVTLTQGSMSRSEVRMFFSDLAVINEEFCRKFLEILKFQTENRKHLAIHELKQEQEQDIIISRARRAKDRNTILIRENNKLREYLANFKGSTASGDSPMVLCSPSFDLGQRGQSLARCKIMASQSTMVAPACTELGGPPGGRISLKKIGKPASQCFRPNSQFSPMSVSASPSQSLGRTTPTTSRTISTVVGGSTPYLAPSYSRNSRQMTTYGWPLYGTPTNSKGMLVQQSSGKKIPTAYSSEASPYVSQSAGCQRLVGAEVHHSGSKLHSLPPGTLRVVTPSPRMTSQDKSSGSRPVLKTPELCTPQRQIQLSGEMRSPMFGK